jgi:hypothetical protein
MIGLNEPASIKTGSKFASMQACIDGVRGSFCFRGKLMKRTREQVAETIEAFVNGTGRQWDWDGFTSIRIDDPELEEIRKKCVALPSEFPPATTKDYCSEAGIQVMRGLLDALRSQPAGRS